MLIALLPALEPAQHSLVTVKAAASVNILSIITIMYTMNYKNSAHASFEYYQHTRCNNVQTEYYAVQYLIKIEVWRKRNEQIRYLIPPTTRPDIKSSNLEDGQLTPLMTNAKKYCRMSVLLRYTFYKQCKCGKIFFCHYNPRQHFLHVVQNWPRNG
jgi:hypothetical protein